MDWWEKNFLKLELSVALAITSLLLFLGEFMHAVDISVLKEDRIGNYTAISAISSSLLGFIITIVTILLPLADSKLLKLSQRNYHQLWETFFQAIKLLGATTIFSLGGLFLYSSYFLYAFFFYSTILFMLLSTIRIGRCIWIVEKLIKNHM